VRAQIINGDMTVTKASPLLDAPAPRSAQAFQQAASTRVRPDLERRTVAPCRVSPLLPAYRALLGHV
jgi:hypothetical protein